jgi:DNA-binding FrmR family transcriptional regulator
VGGGTPGLPAPSGRGCKKQILNRLATIEGHLASCVPTGFKNGRDDEMIRELSELSRK